LKNRKFRLRGDLVSLASNKEERLAFLKFSSSRPRCWFLGGSWERGRVNNLIEEKLLF